jgi:hypothetical protein
MLRKIALLMALLILGCATIAVAAESAGGGAVTQGDLAKKLVDLFGWSEGVPEKATDKDYLALLGGKRTFRFEAEDIYDSTYDSVNVRTYDLFGPFTGRGWLHGVTVPTAVHFKVFIPIAGKYTLKVSTKGDDQLWSVAGKAFKINAGERLKEMVIGQMFIPAGTLEFNAVLPPGGAIDNLLFTAPDLAPVEPLAGWDFPARLTGGQLAEVAAALLGTEGLLPEDPAARHKQLSAAAAVPSLPLGLFLTDTPILGKPLADKWVRAGQVGMPFSMPVQVDVSGVYQLRVRFVGSTLVCGFGDRSVTVPGKPYLDWVDCGVFRLRSGVTPLNFLIPPSGGIDTIELIPRKSSPADYVALTKLGKGAGDAVTAPELDRLLKPLAEQFKERR